MGYLRPALDLKPGEVRLLKHLPQPAKLIVDVGSNIGLYSATAERYNPEARVLSYDPLWGTPAVGSRAGFVDLLVFPGSEAISTGVPKMQEILLKIYGEKHAWEKRRVPVERLDVLLTQQGITPEDQFDLLKIDVEGMELDVLMGLGDYRPRLIQYEYGAMAVNAGYTMNAIQEWLFHNLRYASRELDFCFTQHFNLLAGDYELITNMPEVFPQDCGERAVAITDDPTTGPMKEMAMVQDIVLTKDR